MKKLLTINAYKVYGDSFGDFLRSMGHDVEHYSFKEQPKQKFQSKKQRVWNEIIAFFKLVMHIQKMQYRKVYCTGNQLGTLAFFRIFKSLCGDESHLYIHNFYLHGLSKSGFVKNVLRWLLYNDRVTVICQSPNEVTYYKSLSDRCTLTFIPYCSNFTPLL